MITPKLDEIPPELQAVPHWLVWKAGPVKPNLKFDKIPVHPETEQNLTGEILAQTITFDEAVAAYKSGRFSGLGFYPKNTEFVIGDIDGVVEDGRIADWAIEDVGRLGTYTEISPSGRGLRWIAIGRKPGPETNNRDQHCEMYDKDSKQFLTVTGHVLPAFDIIRDDIQHEVDAWYTRRIAKSRTTTTTPAPEEGPGNSLMPKEVKERLLASPKMRRLWEGDTSDYPSRSEAELALLDALAELTAGNLEMMREVYFESEFALSVYSDKAERCFEGTAQKAIQGTRDRFLRDGGALFTGGGGKDDKRPCQLALAREVIERIGQDNVLHDGRSFWRWDDAGVWRRIDDRVVKQVAHDVLAAHGKVSRSAVDSVTDIAKTECFSTAVLEPTQEFVNAQNGELHWTGRLWELRPHQKASHAISQIPVAWEAGAKCPRFEQFLGEVFHPDEDAGEKKTLLLELMGYSLVPSAEYEKFALLVGNGANGKSVVLHVLQALLGRENCAAVSPVQFNNRFQKAHLHGKLANLVTELPEGAVIADAELKAIVSGELITAEHKLQKPFDFRPTCTVWVATNHMPGTRDFSDALFRRACVIKFNRTFSEEEQDKRLKDKLEQELPGILCLALTAYGHVLQRGAFTMPPSVIEARQEWRLDADQVAAFLDDEVEQAPGEKTESQALYDRYRLWADRAGISMRVGRNMFTRRLARFGYSPAKGAAGVRFIWGLRLKNRSDHWV